VKERLKVRCPECAADVPPLREFCPKCGAATDPGLRQSLHRGPGGRSPEELKRNRKTVLIGAAALLLALGVAGKFSWPARIIHIESHHRDGPKGPVTIDADQLYQAYRDDPDGAAKRFGGREMVVSGEFIRIVPDGWGSLDLRLKTSNPEKPLGIDVAQLALDDAKKLRPGQRVTVSCQHMGSGGDVLWVQDCAIQAEGGDGAQPPAPTPPAPPPPTPESR
jgi:hypothetical protein